VKKIKENQKQHQKENIPFFKTWNQWYFFLILFLIALITFFYFFTKYFS